ncbi:MAG TPA: hypothetical protein VNA57_09800 [Acidimicrobiales bacterium]|nr:hypothetical protein [Acidimicrobiales bacterium]
MTASLEPRGAPAGRLDWPVVGRAALVAVGITVPVSVAVRIFRGEGGDGEGSSLWVVAVVALFAGFGLAGNFAARRRPEAPLLHAATAAGAAFATLAVATVLRRLASGEGVTAPLVLTLGLLLQIAVSLAMLGAYLGMRHRARREQEQEPGPEPDPGP